MTSFDTLNVVLERVWRSARGAAQVLEAGQERRPLTERFDVLGGQLWDPTLRALVVGLTVDGAARALSWISGKDHGPALISALKKNAFAEVQLDNGAP